ncbi:MAG: PEGA domain-containing protein [Gammaproteobacteria bacterium]
MSAEKTIQPAKFEPPKDRPRGSSFRLRAGAVITAAALLFSIGVAWFLLTGKAVYIETIPAGAETNITGELKLRLADRYLLRPGDYRLRIRAEGYHPLETTLAVNEEQNQEYRFELSRLPGHLAVTSRPDAAVVFLNGEQRGKTPVTARDIPHGKHTLRLQAQRYLPHEEDIEIEGLGRTQQYSVGLKPAWANVTLESSPAGAQVYVDDDLAGITPLTTEILQGERRIRVKLEGHKAWQKTLNIKAGEPQSLTDIRLQPADALVRIVTSPAGAGITVNGEYLGVSPLEAAVEPGASTSIRLFKQGYKRAARTVNLDSGEEETLRVDLQPELASVEIRARPENAQLIVDGQARGEANQVLNLPAREHRIEIRREGYQPFKTTLTPRPGIDQVMRVTLKTLREVKLEAMKPIMETAAGQTIKLFRPDAEFTMGASRREPGRRANETLRRVKLSRAFYLSVREVTNAEYRRFVREHDSGEFRGASLNKDNQPVVNITWEQAAKYCNWLSGEDDLTPFYRERDGSITGINSDANGYRLPTEAEWAWAARYQTQDSLLKFPWGQEMPPPEKSGNYADESAAHLIGRIIHGYDDGHAVTAPAGSFPASGKGLYDMGGNAAEWVNDFYDIMVSQTDTARTDPMGPERGEHHVIRGSSWTHGSITELRLSYRDYGSEPRDDVGFRIARFME